MIEERGKSVVLENTLSGGLCGTVTASGESWGRRNRHSVTDVGKVVDDGVRGLSRAISEGKEEKDDGVEVGMVPMSSGRFRVVEPMASISEGCGSSLVSDACDKGTVGGEGGRSSNRMCTFRMRSSNNRASKGISLKN